jgi:hypothetical protein
MDIKSFKQAQNEEYARRNSYEQDMIKKRHTIQSEPMPFHPLNKIQSHEQSHEKNEPNRSFIELDLIDSPQSQFPQGQGQFSQGQGQFSQGQGQFPQGQGQFSQGQGQFTQGQSQFSQGQGQFPQGQGQFSQGQGQFHTPSKPIEISQLKYQHKISPHQLQTYQTVPSYRSAPPMDNPNTTPQPFLPHIEDKESVIQNYSLSSQRPGFYKNDEITETKPIPTPKKAPVSDHKQLVYKAFDIYFNNPSLMKYNDVHDNHSLYYARVQSLLSDPRYIVVVSDPDMRAKGAIVSLKDIPWKSFQLRIIEKEIPCPDITYDKTNNGVFDDIIILVRRDKLQEKVIYQCKFNPLTVELLPTKKGSIMDYPEQSTLETAMDSFHCVLYFS